MAATAAVGKDPEVNDESDEEADSDFDGQASDRGSVSSSSDDETPDDQVKSRKKAIATRPQIEELDSGDEVTIKERKKSKRRQKRTDGHLSSDDDGEEGWRAKTRSMRVQEREERQKKALVSIKESTIDVNSIWKEMNKPGPLPPIRIEGQEDEQPAIEKQVEMPRGAPESGAEETITIKRRYEFAGEFHIEEKSVPKSSREAKDWIARQEIKQSASETTTGKQRPLRKFSRFDPNYANLEGFANPTIKAHPESYRAPKLNVVEKSKMDWTSHVDTEGLKDELDAASKSKDAYLNRVDFLSSVEQRKEEEARQARQKG